MNKDVKFTEAAFLIEDLIKLCKQQHEALKMMDTNPEYLTQEDFEKLRKAIDAFNKLFK